jgi:flagellar protein FlaG
MDGIANVAKQQQTQTSTMETQGRAVSQVQQQTQQPTSTEIAKQINEEATKPETSINSEKDVQNLVQELNKALEPMGTNLKFGVDSQDVFYVSVIEAGSNKEIRRFPAEQAQEFLPKMQEVTGVLFDSKG